MSGSNGHPRIYGYARASSNRQVKSPEVQRSLIEEKAKTIQGDWVHSRTDAATSATEIRWNKRSEYRKLMDEMEPGDHLIVWRFDRIERSPFAMVHALEWLVNRGVKVHILEFGGMQLDLDTPQGRMLAMIMATFAGFFADQLSEAVKAAKAWRKERGLPYTGAPGLGKKRRRRRVGGKEIIEDFWDQHLCDLIREIKTRKDDHEFMAAIARDFGARGEKTWNGKSWSTRRKRDGSLVSYKLYRVYWSYTELLATGQDLMGVPCTPEAQEKAKRQLAQRQRERCGRDDFFEIGGSVSIAEAAEMVANASGQS